MEIVWLRDDGIKVRTYAYYSYRCGPIGQYVIDDMPLDEWRKGRTIISMMRA